jgi:hypothetical protein
LRQKPDFKNSEGSRLQPLQGEVFINDSFDTSSHAAVVLVKYQGKQLRIDILANLFGLDKQAVIDDP